MKEKLITISNEMLLNIQRAKVLSDFVLEKDDTKPEIYVPLYFIKETLINLEKQNDKLETILLNNLK